MKKKYKALLAIGSVCILGTAMINNTIFQMHNKDTTPKPNEHFYKFKYGNIKYTVHGEGEPLLLIHDIFIGANLGEWQNTVNHLAKHYKVYAIDLLGFGASCKPDISYSSYLYVSLINSFITDIIGEKCYVVASSGSAPFAVLATSFKNDNFKKLILVSPVNSINFYSKFTRSLVESPLIGTTIYNIMSSKFYRRSFLENMVYFDPSKITDSIIDNYHHTAHIGGANAKYPIALLVGGYLDVNISTHLKNISIPTHIIWGAENKLNNIGNYDSIRSLNPDIDITIINETGLQPHSESPLEFTKACKKFL